MHGMHSMGALGQWLRMMKTTTSGTPTRHEDARIYLTVPGQGRAKDKHIEVAHMPVA